jgi:hypothetical protein
VTTVPVTTPEIGKQFSPVPGGCDAQPLGGVAASCFMPTGDNITGRVWAELGVEGRPRATMLRRIDSARTFRAM